MNKTAIKNFAIWARNKLIADVSYDARLIGITEDGIAKPLPQSFGGTQFFDIGTAEPYSISGEAVRQRDKLIEVIQQKEKDTDYKTAYQYVIEEVAYTWFNRLIAIRFMEVNDYLPSHIRVLSSESGKLEPDLVTTPFDAELPFTAEEEAQIFQLKQDNKLDEVFRILFLKQCNALNEILPALFEKTKNYTELLLSLSVIDQDGVVYHLIHDIPEDDFNIERGGQVEIIGWLYQYYITDGFNALYDGNKATEKIAAEELPFATQLFTPDWIVRYMVENSLGRLWVEGHPECGLKENWKYYLEEAQQEPEVQAKLAEIRKEYAALNPEDIKLIDPCMGSGHILVYAFDVLMQIYESAGYSQRDAAKSILEHNIYGLDIDDRAYQLAYFAVMMKARQYNRRILNGENTCHVYAIQQSNSINRAHLKYFGAGMDDIEKNAAKMQLEGLLDTLTDAKEYGSILNVESYNWDLLRRFVASEDTAGQISMDSVGVEDTAEQLNRLLNIGETMARKYWTAVTNPPYLNANRMNSNVIGYIEKYYKTAKQDLSMVMYQAVSDKYLKRNAYVSFITPTSWMFSAKFKGIREQTLKTQRVVSIADCGTELFEGKVGHLYIAAWVAQKCEPFGKSTYVDVSKYCYSRRDEKPLQFLKNENRGVFHQKYFEYLPDMPMAYNISDRALRFFTENHVLADVGDSRQGLTTSDNKTFTRSWYEVNIRGLNRNCKDVDETKDCTEKWFPFLKGGAFQKWYQRFDTVVNYANNGEAIKTSVMKKYTYLSNPGFVVKNTEWYFKQGLTWNDVGGERFNARLMPQGYIFADASPSFFTNDDIWYYLAYFNSAVFQVFASAICQGLHYSTGQIPKIPVKRIENRDKENISEIAKRCYSIVENYVNENELSIDFDKSPLLGIGYVEKLYENLKEKRSRAFDKLKSLEEELNRIFIDIYGLQDELTPEVEDKDVTVRKADLQRDIKSLLSYAVGCMFGRYSLDVEGLAYAGGEWDSSKYQSYIPDADNVIPITDEEYLDDDIVSRLCAWLKVVYGADTLEANLDYIAKALGNKGSTSREIIRNYFLNDFFKDHCQTYSVTGSGKRPIYWLFDSGKQNGFKALVYLHRYTPDTIGNLRIDYLHKMQRVYESEINRMQDMMDHSGNAREVAAASKRKDKLAKQLKECREYDEKISHLALSRIELDLDDGVKVNYRKLQTAQDGKFYEVLADSKNIMVKEKK